MPLTRMSTRPKASRVCWIASSAALLSTMSPGSTRASPPAFSTALRASASRSSERPMMATFAPTAARAPQVLTPTPPEPPATTATRSASVKRCSSSVLAWDMACGDLRDRGGGGVGSADGGALGGELVPQRGRVERLDVVHHVALPDVHRAELVAEVDARDRLLARPPLGHRLGDGTGPLEQDGALGGQVGRRRHGAVPGDDGVDVEARDQVEGAHPSVDVRRHEPGLALGEDGVAGEHDALVGHVDGDLAGGVPGRVEQVERLLADLHLQVTGEDEVTGVRVLVVGVAVGD